MCLLLHNAFNLYPLSRFFPSPTFYEVPFDAETTWTPRFHPVVWKPFMEGSFSSWEAQVKCILAQLFVEKFATYRRNMGYHHSMVLWKTKWHLRIKKHSRCCMSWVYAVQCKCTLPQITDFLDLLANKLDAINLAEGWVNLYPYQRAYFMRCFCLFSKGRSYQLLIACSRAEPKTKALVRSGTYEWWTNRFFNGSYYWCPGSLVPGFIQKERKLSSSGSFSTS